MKKDGVIILLLLLILLVLGYNAVVTTRLWSEFSSKHAAAPEENRVEEKPASSVNPYKNADLKTEIISNPDGTFGYRVLLNGSPIIAQPNIPGLPGNAGFSDTVKAQKTARLILHKIRNNIMPPAVTIEELDSLGVL